MRSLRRTAVVLALTCTAVLGLLPVSLPLVASATPAGASRTMGSEPLADILAAAQANARCGLSRDQLAAIMVAPIYFEAGATATAAPSPMALSRWDIGAGLYAFADTSPTNPYRRAFFHPGIGMWQFDSAGGRNMTAADAINTATAANQAASEMATLYCNGGNSRVAAWVPWYGCGNGGPNCEAVYNELIDGTTFRPGALVSMANVTRTGGMEYRTCVLDGVEVGCAYVDPARAQGNTGSWTYTPNGTNSATAPFGPVMAPLALPFYVISHGGREWRVWLPQDTGYDTTISADKPITANARSSLVWKKTTTLCDLTTQRGACGRVAQTPWGQFVGNPFGTVDAVTPAIRAFTVGGWVYDPDTNDPVSVHVYVDGAFHAAVLADVPRPDVAPHVPGYGDQHGFLAEFTGVAEGAHHVCLFAINVGPYGTTNPVLGCQDIVVQAPPPGPFADVDSWHPFVSDIQWLVDADIATGYDDDTFRPTEDVTRQAVAAFLWRAEGRWPAAPEAPTFLDVGPSHTFFAAISWMAGEQITTGYDDHTFRPTEDVTRQAVAAFLWRAHGSPPPTASAPTFADVPASNPFSTAIRWMAEQGITTGYTDGTFRPEGTVSRQAVAAFLHRADAVTP